MFSLFLTHVRKRLPIPTAFYNKLSQLSLFVKKRSYAPAMIQYYNDGRNGMNERDTMEEWNSGGVITRRFGPAVITKYGYSMEEKWLYRGELHREDGPAVVTYKNNKIMSECWYRNGIIDRVNGPAVSEYDIPVYVHWDGTECWHYSRSRSDIPTYRTIREWYSNGNLVKYSEDDVVLTIFGCVIPIGQ